MLYTMFSALMLEHGGRGRRSRKNLGNAGFSWPACDTLMQSRTDSQEGDRRQGLCRHASQDGSEAEGMAQLLALDSAPSQQLCDAGFCLVQPGRLEELTRTRSCAVLCRRRQRLLVRVEGRDHGRQMPLSWGLADHR